ncbi:glycoside hydrolase family 15 protein [Phytohalomonas tamaricis]|uniref:glycoside hydrolase family 15 protein n=1 Tax=Phytohalomonas tamaricis TaxID=2081032 RepID=UPI000D0B1AD0|nr:glycoside hydrolase family 15 protein [Phytohalomonas tamaricis]
MTQRVTNPVREEGYADLESYAALGNGRSVALVAADGSIDWWCVPDMDSPPLFDRILEAERGGFFCLQPVEEYRIERCYRDNSNVLETMYITASGSARVTESINSNTAGRLPWEELARRIEGIEGSVEFTVCFRASTRDDAVSPWIQETPMGNVIVVGDLMTMFRHSDDLLDVQCTDRKVTARLETSKGSRSLVAILATQGEPLAVPPIEAIDERIEVSHTAWRNWAEKLDYDGHYRPWVIRSALALKFLIYSPSGAIVAAPTTSLPERIGGDKNYDYRYAWIRDACLTIKGLLHAGALEECQASFSWLTQTILKHKSKLHVCYTLRGDRVPEEGYPHLEGYKGSKPVRVGNRATGQFQLSLYGDVLATASLFADAGHVIDIRTGRLLGDLANQCADRWRQKDAGIWELPEEQHYTHSKMGCWLALAHAVKLAEAGHIEPTWAARWRRECERIRSWIDTHCWSEARQAYTFYAGTERLDAAQLLTHRFGYDGNRERMLSTYRAIREELGRGPLLYRYSGVDSEEGAFIACSFWMVEALTALECKEDAEAVMDALIGKLDGNLGLLSEMVDPASHKGLGNFPQGLSHLALICGANALSGGGIEEYHR